MSQFPTEEEEFELLYQDEMELLDHEPPAGSARSPQPSTSKQIIQQTIGTKNDLNLDQYPTDEEQFELLYQDELELLDQEHTLLRPGNLQPSIQGNSALQSPQLSKIFNQDYHVNRQLCENPNPIKHISSTPLTKFEKHEQFQPLDPLIEIQNIGINRKRRLEDLFGDIADIPDDSYVDPEVKKQKYEEERDRELIAKILEARKYFRETLKPVKETHIDRLNSMHEFKKRNLSPTVPKWPFLRLIGWNDERIYIRFHSEEYEFKEINDIHLFNKDNVGLLGESKEDIWNVAQELILKRTQGEKDCAVPSNSRQTVGQVSDENLWVEKYKPKKYIDLLSDESTNRSLLFWLRMWDKVVFGKEFKHETNIKQQRQLNTFNKFTGRFESNGGWRRKTKQSLNRDKDTYGRPMQKVALLCGPPGLGKTTLAHTIAHHAGYNVCELNASDDRNPEAFRLALENGTQMSSVLNKNKKPNCIILDEIDGAPQQSIDFLIRFISDKVVEKNKKATKIQKKILKRPIICICNDMYASALRQLRQIAFVVDFPPIGTSRLAERLLDISYEENLKTDLSTLLTLAEKSGNDIRSCISMLQFFNAMKKRLTLEDVLNASFGKKDRSRGLFSVWNSIFQIQRPKKTLTSSDKSGEYDKNLVTMTDMSVTTRAQNILDVVHMGGDYERLMQGVYENYLNQKMPDPHLKGVVEATQWFCFFDLLQNVIKHTQNYTIYPYLQFGFVAWHLLFASLAWPKITFPIKGFEFNQKLTTQQMIFKSFQKGITAGTIGIGEGCTLLIETIPYLKKILSPHLRAVSQQLLNSREQYDLRHIIEVMADLGLMFTQVKSMEGTYKYQMEPNLDILFEFDGFHNPVLNYFGRQLVSKEVEIEQMKRSAPKFSDSGQYNSKKIIVKEKDKSQKNISNHLQLLKPTINRQKNTKEMIYKDFFGRLSTKETTLTVKEGGTDDIVKSPICFKYKEGYTNAVRKDIIINDLL